MRSVRGQAGWDGVAGEPDPRLRVVADTDVMADESLRRGYTLVCFGGPEDNAVAAALPPAGLPAEALNQSDPLAVCTYLRPSPFAEERYVVVHAPLGAEATKHRVDEQWPVDWVTRKADDRPWDLTLYSAGFFGDDWQPEPTE